MEPSGDNAQYHPYDLLILKHFPDKDLRHVQRGEHRRLYDSARIKEQFGIQPPRDSWPLPPPRPYEELEPGVEEWRRTAIRTIDTRVSSYANAATLYKALGRSAQIKSPTELHERRPHRALLITEVLEKILRHGAPRDQYAARDVCCKWRHTIEYILSSSYRSHFPCSPVEYHSPFKAHWAWQQPSEEELAQLEKRPELLSHEAAHAATNFWVPARITQARALPSDVRKTIRSLSLHANWFRKMSTSTAALDEQRWLDLSQFNFNPYFLDLLSGRVQQKLGRLEVAVKPGRREHLVFQQPLSDTKFVELIGSMFLTEPPCQALGIFVPGRLGAATLEPVTTICDVNGIRIGHLLSTLQAHCGSVVDLWSHEIPALRQQILTTPWPKFTFAVDKLFPWWYYGRPTFVLFLESMEDREVPLARYAHTFGEDYERVCQSQWYEDIPT